MYIDNPESLQKLCDALSRAEVVFFDTEFMREKSFYPKLCLVQLGIDGKNYAIDPLKIDVSELFNKIVSRETVLVFHSGRQDLEIIYNLTGKLPSNIFDTQIAATVCGFGAQASYAELVLKLTGKTLDKSQRYTDWSIRPLSAEQVDYALKDVEYLPEIYQKLSAQIEKEGRRKWLVEDEKALLDISSYAEDSENAWQKIKSKNKRYADMTILRELAKWRDEQARRLDKPRRRIVSDDVLTDFAVQKPKNAQMLEKMRIMGNVSRETMQKLMEIVINADKLPKDSHRKPRNENKDAVDDEVLDMLKILLKYNSAKLGVVGKMVASPAELANFMRGEDVEFMEGWRHEAFGADAELLLAGKLSFRVDNGKFEIIRS